jgi:hypothetical protein
MAETLPIERYCHAAVQELVFISVKFYNAISGLGRIT